ncbi:MAG TPA: hypothetical protein VFJ51_13905 [Nitrososphaeraceae archaeon]|nr:hypothetical protein [Nitrososphaeraceae archaeon]
MNKESSRFLIIHRINLALVFMIVVASIMTALPAAYSKIAYAQTTIVKPKPLETFSAKGLSGKDKT